MSLPPTPTGIRTSAFYFVGALNVLLYSHRVFLIDCVDLICSLYSWWEGFRSSLAIYPWGSILVLFPPLHVGRPLGFAPEAALEDLRLPQ